jgi:hypothetical protein
VTTFQSFVLKAARRKQTHSNELEPNQWKGVKMALEKIGYATKFLGLEKDSQTYEKIRRGVIPPGAVVWVGRHIRIDPEKLAEWATSGGTSTIHYSQPAAQSVAA